MSGVEIRTPEVSVVMPCLNEAETLAFCIEEAKCGLHTGGLVGEIVVADNGSLDGSQAIARGSGAVVVEVATRGYGAALIGGIASSRAEWIVMGDADASYDFGQIPEFIAMLRQGHDLVIGNRFLGGIDPGAMPWLHRYIGNPVLSGIARLLYGSNVRDFHCGLRGFRRDSVTRLRLCKTGMEFASEMIVKAVRAKLDIAQIPARLRKNGRSRRPHLRPWRDGSRHLAFLLSERCKPFASAP
jgi:glycosyltransferase involved in cell wall biosynthesis